MALVDISDSNLVKGLLEAYRKDLTDREIALQQAIESGAGEFNDKPLHDTRLGRILNQLDRLNRSESDIKVGGKWPEFSVQWMGKENKLWMWGCLFMHEDGKDPGVHT